jgi:hypothetical protein
VGLDAAKRKKKEIGAYITKIDPFVFIVNRVS